MRRFPLILLPLLGSRRGEVPDPSGGTVLNRITREQAVPGRASGRYIERQA